MFALENRGETLIFISRHFEKTMTILILHFFFWCTKILTGAYFVLRINQIIYSKQKKKKMDVLFILVFFSALFLQQFFPFTLYRVAYKCRMDRITYHHVND